MRYATRLKVNNFCSTGKRAAANSNYLILPKSYILGKTVLFLKGAGSRILYG